MDYINAQLTPGEFSRIPLGQNPDLIAIDNHVLAFDRDLSRKTAMNTIVLGEMGIDSRISEIVDSYDPQLVGASRFVQGSQYVAADPAIAVDANIYHHALISPNHRFTYTSH
jgi:hypothetical protein